MSVIRKTKNAIRDKSETAIYWSFAYQSGYLPHVIFLASLTCLFGFLPMYLLGVWSIYWQNIYLATSVGPIVNIACFMVFQACFFTVVDKFLDFGVKILSLEQAVSFRDAMLRSLNAHDLESIPDSKDLGLLIHAPNDFFLHANLLLKRGIFSVGVLVGNIIYLHKFRQGLYGIGWLAVVWLIDKIFAHFSGTTQWLNIFSGNTIADYQNEEQKQASLLKKEIQELLDQSTFLRGQVNYFQASVLRIRYSINKNYTKTYLKLLNWRVILQFFKSSLQRLTFPVTTLFLFYSVGIQFPLHYNEIKNLGLRFGDFKQILVAYTSIWTFTSVSNDDDDSRSKRLSSYKQIKDFCSFATLPSVYSGPKTLPAWSRLFLHQIAFSGLVWSGVVLLMDVLRFFQVQTFSPGFFVSYGFIPLLSFATLVFLTDNHLRMIPMASLALTIATTVIAVLGISLIIPSILISSQSFYVWTIMTVFATAQVLTFLGYAYYRRLLLNNKQQKLSLKSPTSQFIANQAVKLADLKLFSSKSDKPRPIIGFTPSSAINIKPNTPTVVIGENGVGKTSLIINSLLCPKDTSFSSSSASQAVLDGRIDLPVTKKFIFTQMHKPLENIKLYLRNKSIGVRGGRQCLSDLQSIFFSLILNNPWNLTEKEIHYFRSWYNFKAIILDFLRDPHLGVDAFWINTLDNDETIDENMNPVRANKLLIACVYAALHLVESPYGGKDERILLAIDEGFSMDREIKSTLLDKLCRYVANAPGIVFYVQVLHDAQLHYLYSDKVRLKLDAVQPYKMVSVSQDLVNKI